MPPQLAELSTFAPLGFAAGMGLLTWFLLRKTFGRLSKRNRGGSGPYMASVPRPTDAWDGAKQDANARFDRQQVELQELARELNGRIDSKMILLGELIEQSKQQSERLEALLAEARTTRVDD